MTIFPRCNCDGNQMARSIATPDLLDYREGTVARTVPQPSVRLRA
jgi:hypothetical protein